MTSEKVCRKDKNQNIQVFVRLRPLNQRERDIKSLGVIEVVNNREVIVRQSQQTSHTKKFTFDRAFGPIAKQVEVYQDVVSPLIEEVLAGYNCTVFAYGQTGTGKTHTMVGENTGDESNWQNDPLAGIIPRALSQLFDELRISNTEYTVRVSYLELYNEELFDLLSTSEDNSKLRIYEDVTRKGSNIVNGLEEITVYNKNEVYKIMAQGQDRKRVASTLMNAQSSRSHTVFTIVVHMKENSPEGEELVKIGKLNLVDLAGSENISKAGSDNPAKRERARECVNINQSLLTLGRVITALVERHPHIPYRESKLTRILQESLGGRTKTSIIATISPGHKDLEETMSTLEYAHRAKNIQNKPEVNQKMTKKAILKEYAEEIDRLKRDLQAARDKNGVYLANETFTEMTLKQEEQRKEIQELLLKKRSMEEKRDRMEAVFSELSQTLEQKDIELNKTRNVLDKTKKLLANTNNVLQTTKLHYEEQKVLVSKHMDTEVKLSAAAQELLQTADVATEHVTRLHDSVDKRRNVESMNLEVTRTYREAALQQRERIASGSRQFTGSLTAVLTDLGAGIGEHTASTTRVEEDNKKKIEELMRRLVDTFNEVKQVTEERHGCLSSACDAHRSRAHAAADANTQRVRSALQALVDAVAGGVARAETVDVKKNVAQFVNQWAAGASERVACLRRTQTSFHEYSAAVECVCADNARRQRDARTEHAQATREHIQQCIVKINEEKSQMEQRLTKQLEEMEIEKKDTETRLTEWMQEERRLLEERMARHVSLEMKAMEDKLAKRTEEVENQKRLLDERVKHLMECQQKLLEENKEEMKRAEADLEQYEAGRVECLNNFNKFNKELSDGTSAIGIDIEAFSTNVVEVVDHINTEMMQALRQAKQDIEEQAKSMVEADASIAQQFKENTDSLLNDVVSSNKQSSDAVLDKIQANNNSTVEHLSTVSSSTNELITTAQSHLVSQMSTLESAQHQVEQYSRMLAQELENQAELEGRFLAQEYTVYTPTGSTPVRQEYRYPRALPTTSPHQRILARYRTMRKQHNDEDCIILESDTDTRRSTPAYSDSESSVSEDSAVFAAPSPRQPSLLPQPYTTAPIMKSTSESDIYVIQKKQGKENGDVQSNGSFKKLNTKPSRLPALTKKPLVERNGI